MDWLQTLTGRITFLLITNLILMFALLPIGLQADGSDGIFVVIMAFGICLGCELTILIFSQPFSFPAISHLPGCIVVGIPHGLAPGCLRGCHVPAELAV